MIKTRPSIKYASGHTQHASVLALIGTMSLGIPFIIYVKLGMPLNYQLGLLVSMVITAAGIITVFLMLSFVVIKHLSTKKVSRLGKIIRYDYKDKAIKSVYTVYGIHLDNHKGLKVIRKIQYGIREIMFAREFLFVLIAIRDGLPNDWPEPRKIKGTSFKLKSDSTSLRMLGLQLTEVKGRTEKFTNALLGAFVQHINPKKALITFWKDLHSPLYTFTISYDELKGLKIEEQLERLNQIERVIIERREKKVKKSSCPTLTA